MELRISLIDLVGFASAAALVILAGCTYNIVQLPDGKTFSIDRVPTTPIYISWVHAEEKNDQLIVNGVLGTVSSRAYGTGHVDVAVIGPGGKILGQTSVDHAPKTVFIESNRRESRFEAHFPFIPPNGSTIRVALHQLPGEHPA